MLDQKQIQSLKRHAKLAYWPAAYLERGHPDRALVVLDLLEVVKTDEREYRVVRITAAGRAATH